MDESMLKQARKNAKLTQKQLAERAGMSQQQLQQYETGKRKPKYETLLKIAKVLNIPIDSLITENEAYALFEEDITEQQNSVLDFEGNAELAFEKLLEMYGAEYRVLSTENKEVKAFSQAPYLQDEAYVKFTFGKDSPRTYYIRYNDFKRLLNRFPRLIESVVQIMDISDEHEI